MAGKNVVEQDVTQGKKKKGKTFMKICIALAITSALILGGWILTSSIVFLRNAILFAVFVGTGIALGTPVAKRISNAITTSKENKRNRSRERNRTRQNEQTLGNVPTVTAPEREEAIEWTPITRSTSSSKKNR